MKLDYSNEPTDKECLKFGVGKTFLTLLNGDNSPDPEKRAYFKQIRCVYTMSANQDNLDKLLKNHEITETKSLLEIMQIYDKIMKVETLDIIINDNADRWLTEQKTKPVYSRHPFFNEVEKINKYLKNCENNPSYTTVLEKNKNAILSKNTRISDKAFMICDVVLTDPSDYRNMKSFVNEIERKIGPYQDVLVALENNTAKTGELVLEDVFFEDKPFSEKTSDKPDYGKIPHFEESGDDDEEYDEESEDLSAFENGLYINPSQKEENMYFEAAAADNSLPPEVRQIAEHNQTIRRVLINTNDLDVVACISKKLVEGYRYHHS